MVDWSGDGMVVVDPVSGQRVTAHLFTNADDVRAIVDES